MENNRKNKTGPRALTSKHQAGGARPGTTAAKDSEQAAKKIESTLTPLVDALSIVETPEELSDVFRDLCTPNEWKAICDRWLVAQLINQGISYRKIYELTGVSTATITRVGRALSEGQGYTNLLQKTNSM